MDDENGKVLEDIISKVGEGTGASIKQKPDNFYSSVVRQSRETELLTHQENRELLEMRKRWARWILIFIGTIMMFDIILVSFYGLGVWEFKDTGVVIAIVTENFLKIISLGVLVTVQIFKKIF